MHVYHEKTTVAAISELRNKSEAILSALKDHRIVLERHHKPVAVMIDYKNYALMEQMIEMAEDYILGSLALRRDKGSKKGDFIDLKNW